MLLDGSRWGFGSSDQQRFQRRALSNASLSVFSLSVLQRFYQCSLLRPLQLSHTRTVRTSVLHATHPNKQLKKTRFYYMANAMGRLTGTLVSGALYTYAGASVVYGLGWCFVASVAFALLATVVTAFIRDDTGGLMCGSRVTLVKE